MEITKGRVTRAQRVTLYGPEGIGKSTMGSLFPKPLFVDIERSTDELEVDRAPRPRSFQALRQTIVDVTRDSCGYATLVIDTADWAERLATNEVCAQNGIVSLGGAEDYGRSFNMLAEAWAKWLDSLTELCVTGGVNVIVLAHAMMRKFEQPEEIGAFDRWELKLQKRTSSLLKEWSDMLLFLGYKTLVVGDGKSKTKKGTGGARVIRTEHHPCWDAKNRQGLPREIKLGPEHKTMLPTEIANVFFNASSGPTAASSQTQQQKQQEQKPAQTEPSQKETASQLPSSLIQLMANSGITEEQIRQVVAQKGYYPAHTPIANYTQEFVDGVLVAAWDKVVAAIKGGQPQ